MTTITKAHLAYSKSTPGTHVYVDADPHALVSTLYISKRAMPNGAAPRISLLIEDLAPAAATPAAIPNIATVLEDLP